MDKYIWYEVYKSDEEGSQTLKICKTFEEAKSEKEKLSKVYTSYCLHIDKWQNRENPIRLAGEK